MPRVSDEHLAARRQQILDAAWACFARQGFHATSMQDVFAEAGLSAGAVYRYFPSKTELVRSTAEGILGNLTQVIDEMLDREQTPDPAEAVRTIVNFVTTMATSRSYDPTRIALHVWAESLHDAEIRGIVHTVAHTLRDRLTQLAERWVASGAIAPDSSPPQVAVTLYGLMIGFVGQLHLIGDVTADDYADGMVALIRSRVAAEVPRGDT
ncbi:TetR family transcriptional regulator [Haloactinopolyspora alba]|uniref:TetR family transcriptional regulator n=1 Tax=Haloactinopolyspora alba TaxID=648780 RepID=A0A2P8E9J5_9ACTN|nr:TetR/AcrR family transcriptional regulator [Haloactinopolyspora alba]PSL06156.1 TetR family transcriptional regulator [Haloactinopolyspora alba]